MEEALKSNANVEIGVISTYAAQAKPLQQLIVENNLRTRLSSHHTQVSGRTKGHYRRQPGGRRAGVFPFYLRNTLPLAFCRSNIGVAAGCCNSRCTSQYPVSPFWGVVLVRVNLFVLEVRHNLSVKMLSSARSLPSMLMHMPPFCSTWIY